jgi:hypothetical protein
LFHSARWKAYLQQIREEAKNNPEVESDSISSLFHKIPAQQSTLFAKPPDNGHQAAAEAHLKRSEELMKDCTSRVDALEETLANTPKPSEALNWDMMTLGEMLGQSSE